MSIRGQAALDARANLSADGDHIVLTDEAGREYRVRGKVFRTDQKIDPVTGAAFHDPRLAASVSLADIGGTPSDGWTARTTDVTGAEVSGSLVNVELDRTLGLATFNVEVF